jgi:hypothetical protein
MLILRCQYASGSISLHSETINGRRWPRRDYRIQEHKVVLCGDPAVVTHDISALLHTPGDVYRMPTPEEQEADEAAQRRATIIHEGVPGRTPIVQE